jgi:hypothetical protein
MIDHEDYLTRDAIAAIANYIPSTTRVGATRRSTT